MGYMEAPESLKYPLLITRDTSPSRVVLEIFGLGFVGQPRNPETHQSD
jgi:hypothetical protein